MTFEEMKKIVVDTLNCEEDKVTMNLSFHVIFSCTRRYGLFISPAV